MQRVRNMTSTRKSTRVGPRRHRQSALVPALVVAGLSAACTSAPQSSTHSDTGTSTTPSTSSVPAGSTTTVTTAPAESGFPATGVYYDGPVGEPHYVLDLTSSSSSAFDGSIIFAFEDGTTTSPMRFTGTASGGQATLTMASGGGPVTATYAQDSIMLASCTTYLQYARTASLCSFTLASGAPGSG